MYAKVTKLFLNITIVKKVGNLQQVMEHENPTSKSYKCEVKHNANNKNIL